VNERERLRLATTELQQRLRGEPDVPQVLYELLDVIVRRLDRIELGTFDDHERPTTKEPRTTSSGTLVATVEAIFDEAKKAT